MTVLISLIIGIVIGYGFSAILFSAKLVDETLESFNSGHAKGYIEGYDAALKSTEESEEEA